jgi:hypothetical protein
VRLAAIEGGRILLTLDGDFANVIRFPPAATPGVLRLRLHPPSEEAIDAALRFAIWRLADVRLEGKLDRGRWTQDPNSWIAEFPANGLIKPNF